MSNWTHVAGIIRVNAFRFDDEIMLMGFTYRGVG